MKPFVPVGIKRNNSQKGDYDIKKRSKSRQKENSYRNIFTKVFERTT